MSDREVYRQHGYGPRWNQCELCTVSQPDKDLVHASAIGFLCADQERCKRWRIQMLEQVETQPNIRIADFVEAMRK